MTAVGRALMAKPTMILLDEPSMGLAPQIVEEIFGIVKDLNEKKGEFSLAEQNTMVALATPISATSWKNGRGGDGRHRQESGRQRGREGVLYRHLKAGRKSFRDVKHYRRRKRWLA